MDRTIRRVLDKNLCTGCGTCAGVCPTKSIEISTENPFPSINKKTCTNCGLCLEVCPGHSFNFIEMNKKLFNSSKLNLLGYFNRVYIGHSTDEKIRKGGSSGGVVTSLLLYGIENNLINGAFVVGRNKENPWIAEPILARNRRQIIDGAQSKYTVVPVNKLIQKIKHAKGKYAFVGLPCHIQGLRKIKDKRIKEKFRFIISLYCGFNSSLEATSFIIKKLGVKDFNNIKSMEYRAGDWPGGFKIVTKDGKSKFIDKFRHNFVIPLFWPHRCKLCIDLSGEFSDISVGDAWFPELIKEGEGWSLILTRTKTGDMILKDAEKKGYIKIKKIQNEKPIISHKHMIEYKKLGGMARTQIYKRLGVNVPDYGFNISKMITTRRIISEIIFLFILSLVSNRIARRIAYFMPISIMGWFAAFLRKIKTR